MKLSIKDRIHLPILFPAKSDLVTLRLVKDIVAKTEITQGEVKKVKLVPTEGGYKWDKEQDEGVEVKFTDLELGVLKERIQEMDKAKDIPAEMADLCIRLTE